jgi:hypothetical protein
MKHPAENPVLRPWKIGPYQRINTNELNHPGGASGAEIQFRPAKSGAIHDSRAREVSPSWTSEFGHSGEAATIELARMTSTWAVLQQTERLFNLFAPSKLCRRLRV